MSEPFISVVVPVRNEDRCLRACLASLVSQRFDPARYEVVVADGESEDRTRDIVAEFAATYPNVRLVPNPGRLVSCGRNVGIGAARGEIIAFVEGHAFVGNDFLSVIEEAFRDPEVRCLGRSVEQYLPGDSPIQQATGLLRKSRLGRNPHSLRFSEGRASFVDPLSIATVYRREVFDQVGLFHESFATNEDVELNWRVRCAGIMARRTPGLRYFLHPRNSVRGFVRQMFRYGYGKALLVRLHPRAFRAGYAAPSVVLAAALLGVSLPAARWALAPLGLYLLLSLVNALSGRRAYPALRLLLSLLMVCGFGAGFACGLVGPRSMAGGGPGRSPAGAEGALGQSSPPEEPESGFGLKQAGKQALTYAAGLWAMRAAGFLLVPLYTRRLDPAQFGIYELLSRTFDILCLVLPAGMVMALMRFYGLAEGRARRQVASTAILCLAAMGALAAAGLWALREPIASRLLHDRTYGSLVLLLGLWVWFEMLFSVSCGLLRVRGQAALYTAANVARSLLTIGLGLWLVWWRDLGLPGVMIANVAGSGFGALAIVGYALASVGIRFSPAHLRSFLAFGLPLMATAILSASAGTVDRYILNGYTGAEQVAILGLAARVTMILGVATIAPIGLTYTPFIFSTVRRKDAQIIFGRARTYMGVLVAGSGLMLALFAPEIVAILAPASYRSAVGVARIALIASCLYGMSPQLEIGIYLHGATTWKLPAFAVLAGTSLMLNLALIPRYGAIGAALAQVGAQAAYLGALYMISERLYPMPYRWSRLGRIALAGGLPWLAGSGLIPALHFASPASRAALLAAFPLGLWVLRVADAEERAQLRLSARRLLRIPRAALSSLVPRS